jgi:hypothetical protein
VNILVQKVKSILESFSVNVACSDNKNLIFTLN